MMAALKVGELARQTGLTVRTLHYYEEVGLLWPSKRSEKGHRLYTVEEVVRLQQIKSLRQLGLSLEEVREILENPEFSPRQIIQMHLSRLKNQIELQQQLCHRLEGLATRLEAAEEISVDEFIKTIEAINMVDTNFTPEQLEEIKERGRQLGEERIRQVEAEWPVVIAGMTAAMEQGADPASEEVQVLAKRWQALVLEFTGGNPEIHKVLNNRYKQDVSLQQQTGVNPKLMEYVRKAIEVQG